MKVLLIILILLGSPSSVFAQGPAFAGFGTTSNETICVGWENVDCVATGSGTGYVSASANRSFHRPTYTSTYNATIDAVWIETYNWASAPDIFRGIVYKLNTGTSNWEPICYADLSPGDIDAHSWNRIEMTTGTCTIVSGGQYRYGVDIDIGGGFMAVQRNPTGGDGLYYIESMNDPPANIADASYSLTSGNEMAFMMEFTTN